jgi:uncharacterized protein (DUF4415 family)
MSGRTRRKTVVMPTVEEDRAITAAAKSDPDAQPLTRKQLEAMVPIRALRGRPPSANRKQLVSIRYSPEVLAWFRATGPGWQSRLDRVLKDYMKRRVKRAENEA